MILEMQGLVPTEGTKPCIRRENNTYPITNLIYDTLTCYFIIDIVINIRPFYSPVFAINVLFLIN